MPGLCRAVTRRGSVGSPQCAAGVPAVSALCASGWLFPRLGSYYLGSNRVFFASASLNSERSSMTIGGPGESRPSKNKRRDAARTKAAQLRVEQKKRDRRNRVFLQGGIAVVLI